MRTTDGKSTGAVRLHGAGALPGQLAEALSAIERPDRWTHGFHTYPAGLHPDAAASLIEAFPGHRVLDPFCGGGTVLVEARAAGREAFGQDVSPIALLVASTRTATPPEAVVSKMRSAARALTAEARVCTALEPPPDIARAVHEWYAPSTIAELESLRRGVLGQPDPEVRRLLEAVFSSMLIKVSWRRSDTSARREPAARPAGTTAVLFHKKARELGRRLAALREAVPEGTPPARVRRGDARRELGRSFDLVLTSPPYPATYDYVPLQHLRHVWLGVDARPHEAREIGSRRAWRAGDRAARANWLRDTEAWMGSCAHSLAPGGHLVVVIGDGRTPSGLIDARRPTVDCGRGAGLQLVAGASLERPDHAHGASRWEHVLAFVRV